MLGVKVRGDLRVLYLLACELQWCRVLYVVYLCVLVPVLLCLSVT